MNPNFGIFKEKFCMNNELPDIACKVDLPPTILAEKDNLTDSFGKEFASSDESRNLLKFQFSLLNNEYCYEIN